MSRKRVRNKITAAPLRQVFSAAAAMPAGGSFEAALAACVERRGVRPTLMQRISQLTKWRPAPAPIRQKQELVLVRAVSWIRAKYKTASATKRLRVTETVALGEKRFVALVSVEGREFLIGGGASGVSMLANLSGTPESANLLRTELSVEGNR